MFWPCVQEQGDVNFGIDWNGPNSEDDGNILDIPEIDNPLLEEFDEFQTIVSPTAPSDNFGIDIHDSFLTCS